MAVSVTGAAEVATAVVVAVAVAVTVVVGAGATTVDVAMWTTPFGSVTVSFRVASAGAESSGVSVTSKLLAPRPVHTAVTRA